LGNTGKVASWMHWFSTASSMVARHPTPALAQRASALDHEVALHA
jgi:hypothetical protein